MCKRILAILTAVILVSCLAVNAFADAEAEGDFPDLTQKGSLTLIMTVDGEPLDSGSLSIYYVANIVKVSENKYDFQLLDELKSAGAALDTELLFEAFQADILLDFAKEALNEYASAPIEDGKASFTDLETGLYLVWQSPENAAEGYDAINPFLISIPKWQGGEYALDVEATPKVSLEGDSSEPPPPPLPPPPPPDIPQTGQLNWPVPVMAFSGAVLLVVGIILCISRRKCDYEK